MDDAKGEFPRSPSITPTRPGRGGVGVRAKRRIGGKAPTNGTGSRASGLRGYLLRFEGPSCRAPTDPRHRASPPSSVFLPRLPSPSPPPRPGPQPRGSRACVRAGGLASPRVSVLSLTCLFPFLSALTMLLRQSLSTLILTMIAVVLWLWLRCSQSLFFAPLPVFAWPPLVERKESRRPPPPLENEFENTTTRRDLYTKREKKKRGIFRENKGGRKWGTRHVCGHSKNV